MTCEMTLHKEKLITLLVLYFIATRIRLMYSPCFFGWWWENFRYFGSIEKLSYIARTNKSFAWNLNIYHHGRKANKQGDDISLSKWMYINYNSVFIKKPTICISLLVYLFEKYDDLYAKGHSKIYQNLYPLCFFWYSLSVWRTYYKAFLGIHLIWKLMRFHFCR